MAILKKGRKGAAVRILQSKLGVDADGDFGSGTQQALKDWQAENGLDADGIAGPDTFVAMGLFQLVLLRRSSKGEAVKELQAALDLDADGKFGAGTEKAVKNWQAENGLEKDGLVGVKTLAALGLFSDGITDEHISALEEPVDGSKEEGGAKIASADMGGMNLWKSITNLFD